MRYKWLLFDADNTLFDFTYSQKKALKQCLEHYGHIFNDEIFSNFTNLNNEIWTAYDRNEISHEEIKMLRFKRLFDTLGIKGIDINEFNSKFIDKLVENSKLIENTDIYLEKLHRKINMAIITNGMKEVQRPRFEKCKHKSKFEQIFISGEMGKSKPNKEYFEYVHKATGALDKSQYLVVGDNIIADIKGAKDYGFDTCWFNPNRISDRNEKYADNVIQNIHELDKMLF
jgi:YjjG family noncanonical pyrimidine nucleotidase